MNGSFNIKTQRKNRRHNENREIEVKINPNVSSPQISKRGDISIAILFRILKTNEFHPTKYMLHNV